jgi:hypothetical protein
MRRGIKGSIALSTVDAFMAAVAFESYAAASSELGIAPTTVMRNVKALGLWLHRVLIWDDGMIPTKYGDEFVPVAWQILQLIDTGGLRDELSKTRVHGDGAVTIEGELFVTAETSKIGQLMVSSRADLSTAIPSKPRISAHDPLIVAFLDERDSR